VWERMAVRKWYGIVLQIALQDGERWKACRKQPPRSPFSATFSPQVSPYWRLAENQNVRPRFRSRASCAILAQRQARTVPVYPYKPIFNLDFQLSKPPAFSDAIALGYAARFNLSPVNRPGLMYDRRFQGYRRVLNGSCSLRIK
jgi:hypothetical protein